MRAKFYHGSTKLQHRWAMSKTNCRILSLQEQDLSAVYQIEQHSYPYPWSPEQFRQELENPVAAVELCLCGEQLAGYVCYWLIAGELQILNIATSPDFSSKGIAAKLLSYIFRLCQGKGLDRAWLEVRCSNQAAIALYRKQGFVDDVVRTGYYRDGEDALLMVRDFGVSAPQE